MLKTKKIYFSHYCFHHQVIIKNLYTTTTYVHLCMYLFTLWTEWANKVCCISQGMARQFAWQFVRKGTQEGRTHTISSRGEFSWWSSPSQKKLSCYSLHPEEIHVLCTHQNVTDVATQTKLPWKHAAIQVSCCREYQRLSLVTFGSSEKSCVRRDQVGDLLSLVAELREEVETLRNSSVSEKDWWNHSLPSLREKQEQPPKNPDIKGILCPTSVRLKTIA